MSLHLKDALSYLPASQLPDRKLTKARVKVLAKQFRTKGGEPKNNGVAKNVGPRMIRAVAKVATIKKTARS